MDSVNQAESPAWSLWTKLAAPALLRCPVLGISAVLVISTPLAAVARALPRSQGSASAQPTQRQIHVLRSYERYLARMRAQSQRASRAVKFAYRQVGKPYQWGGAGPRTYDCSGLVMAAWHKAGLRLPHRADLQHRVIRRKVGLKHLRPGDLVFFSGDHHVGIYVGRRHFLHAPHTGARVQRGTLSGWRLRVFAGAARPGAPAYHPWPHWVRALAQHADHHGHVRPHRRHGHDAAAMPDGPRIDGPDDASPVEQAPPGTGDLDGPTGPDTAEPAGPPVPADDTVPPPAEPDGPFMDAPVVDAPVVDAPASSGAPSRPPAAAHRVVGLSVPLLNMSARAHGGRHHARAADDTPVPGPADHAEPAPPRHRPRSTVRRQHDEQRFDRDFDGTGDDDDTDSGNDGIDLRSLLGDAP
jgi:cell wall-associated NlpC family hydrolase